MRTEKLSTFVTHYNDRFYYKDRFGLILHNPIERAAVYGNGSFDYYLDGKSHRINGTARVYKVTYKYVTRHEYLLQGLELLIYEN